jgi:catechol 2,3-dioxygenase-like lactoylglutathione lyase family enzyme
MPAMLAYRGRMATAFELDHIVLVVSDLERALAWYQRHAGLASVNVDAWRAGQAFFPSLRVNEGTIVDFVEGDPTGARGHLDHICFVVSEDDVASIAADAELEVVDRGERSGARGAGQSVYVRDPDGLLVEFRYYR